MPNRVQRKREKGWRKPENTVYVGRGTFFGNPWVVSTAKWKDRSKVATADEAVEKYKGLCAMPSFIARAKKELRGKNLACWCSLENPCHADILLEIANG